METKEHKKGERRGKGEGREAKVIRILVSHLSLSICVFLKVIMC